MALKKILLAVLLFVVVFFSYVILSVIIAYKRQPKISEEYMKSFDPDDFFSEQISCDRACVIEDNTQALIERLRMIERADDRIILSTFDFRADKSGKKVLAALLNAAKKGVDVKSWLTATVK